MGDIGRILVIAGSVLLILGLVFILVGQFPYLDKLPGDIMLKKDSFSFYFPVVTFLLLSALLTVILNISLRILGK